MPNPYRKPIALLAESVAHHEALNNDFYRVWTSSSLSCAQVRVFAKNYLARTRNTATMITLSILSTDDIVGKVEIVKNLYSEYGYGNPKKAHISLLEHFLTDLLSRMCTAPVSLADVEAVPVLQTTECFIAAQRKLYTNDRNPKRILGTLLGQEWLAYSMLTRLYEGVRNYQHLYKTNDEFHENCEYFYIHIGDAEKEHKAQAITSAAQECYSDADYTEIKRGFDSFLDITAAYWRGIHAALQVTEYFPEAQET